MRGGSTGAVRLLVGLEEAQEEKLHLVRVCSPWPRDPALDFSTGQRVSRAWAGTASVTSVPGT
eukprot:1878996-Rhodomonas_salina.2